MTTIDYISGAEMPPIEITWRSSSGAVINFSTGWSFTLRVGSPGREAVLTKTDGITGADAAPNVTIEWDAGELDDLTAGVYRAQLIARNVNDQDRIMPFSLAVHRAVLA